jgi:hypothetical protein
VEDRHRELGQAGLVVADVARVVAGVVDQDRVAGEGDRADDALAEGDLDRGQDLAAARVLGAERGALDQVQAVVGEQVDDAVLEAEAGDRVVGDVPQDVVEVGLRVQQRGREVVDDVELVGAVAELGAALAEGGVLPLQRPQARCLVLAHRARLA